MGFYSFEKSKTRVGYIILHNNDFVALWDSSKVFRLSKNTFLCNFSFIANWKWNFSSFFYGNQTLLAPKTFISGWARVSENWQSAVDYRKCSSLGSELTTFIDGILSKLLFQWVQFTLTFYFKQVKAVQLDLQRFEIFIFSSLLLGWRPGKMLEQK